MMEPKDFLKIFFILLISTFLAVFVVTASNSAQVTAPTTEQEGYCDRMKKASDEADFKEKFHGYGLMTHIYSAPSIEGWSEEDMSRFRGCLLYTSPSPRD